VSVSFLHLLHLFVFLFSCSVLSPSELYTLSLHDALPIYSFRSRFQLASGFLDLGGDDFLIGQCRAIFGRENFVRQSIKRITKFSDRKSTRLNSSHRTISYAVFCLKKKKTNEKLYQHSTYH